MNTPIRSFEDLDCWKAGRELRLFVARRIVPVLPREERYRLGGQILEAARSEGWTVDWSLETHAHADHLSGAPYVKAKTGAKIT